MTNIIIDKNTPTKKFNHHWKFCVGSAHAAYALRHDYTNQLSELHKDLGIERVRFHGIFDDSMHTIVKAADIAPFPFGKKYTEQSFRQCAVAYDNIISAGMKPFVELSFMPKHLAKSKLLKGAFFYKPIVCMPKAIEKWKKYIKDFVWFLIERYGKEEVETWFFEVWNEPDLPIVFFYGGQKDYFKLYSATALAIKEVDEKLKVGGPATSGSKWIKEFLAYCKETKTPVDFVSTHQYSGDPIGGIENSGEKISINADIFAGFKERKTLDKNAILDFYRSVTGVYGAEKSFHKNALTESAKNVKKLVGNLPLYYTEWNLCASFSAPCNDSSMQAAYNLHSIFGTQESIQGSSIWCFSDLFEELHQFPEEFHGGFGLMTQSGIKKPTYHALKFLNEAGDTVYDFVNDGKIDAAVFEKENEKHIILSNLCFEKTGEPEAVTIEIEMEKPKKAVLNRIDENNCNPLKDWEKVGKPQVPTAKQLEAIKAESAPKDEPAEFIYENGFVKISTTVEANEIKRIVLSYGGKK